MLSEPDRDIEKLCGDHNVRRTAAIASLKVGWCSGGRVGAHNGAGLAHQSVRPKGHQRVEARQRREQFSDRLGWR